MPITQAEFDVLIADSSKRIEGDIRWGEDEDHSPAVCFRAEVLSGSGYPLFIAGRYSKLAETLSFSLIHRGTGRIYGLDLGADHHNPTCEHVGEKHKHRWTDAYRDKMAYVPADITEPPEKVVEVWRQFCAEANIMHHGTLAAPPPVQTELGL